MTEIIVEMSLTCSFKNIIEHVGWDGMSCRTYLFDPAAFQLVQTGHADQDCTNTGVARVNSEMFAISVHWTLLQKRFFLCCLLANRQKPLHKCYRRQNYKMYSKDSNEIFFFELKNKFYFMKMWRYFFKKKKKYSYLN